MTKQIWLTLKQIHTLLRNILGISRMDRPLMEMISVNRIHYVVH